MNMSDYKTSKNKRFRYTFVLTDFSQFLIGVSQHKSGQTKTEGSSVILNTSERRLNKIESDRGNQSYNQSLQKISKLNKIHHYLRFTDESPSIAERVIRRIRNLLKKLVFERRNAEGTSQLPFITKKTPPFNTQLK